MTEPTPQEIAARVRGMAQELADARAALHLKPGQPIGDRIRGLTEELDGRATSIEALRGDLDAVRAALSLAERKVADRAQERSAMWDVLLAVREAAGADEGADLRAVVAALRREAAMALPSRQSGLPQPTVSATADGRVRVEIRHTDDVALEYTYDLAEAARLVADVGTAVARLTPGGPRLGVTADPAEGATLGVCVEVAGEVLHLSPALRVEGPRLEALVRELNAALPPVKHAGEHLEPLLAPLRPAGVLGRGELSEAAPARVIELVLERVRADRREIERLRAANAEHVARLASGTSGAGKRKRIAALEAEVERLKRELRGVELRAAGQGETIKGYQDAASAVVAAAESVGLRMSPSAGSPSPSTVKAAAQDLAAKAARVSGLEDLLAGERAKTLEARREFAELRDAARTMLPEGSTPNPATPWLADVIRGAAKRAGELLAARDLAHENANRARAAEGAAVLRAEAAEAKVARLARPATIALPPALRRALDAVQDIVTGVEATPEGLGEAVVKLVAALRTARRGWAEESGDAARARTELRRLQDDRLATVLPPSALSWEGVRVYPAGAAPELPPAAQTPTQAERALGAIARDLRRIGIAVGTMAPASEIAEAVSRAVGQGVTARQLAAEVQTWEDWADGLLRRYPVGTRGRRGALSDRIVGLIADRDTSRAHADEAGQRADGWHAEVERLRAKLGDELRDRVAKIGDLAAQIVDYARHA